MITLDLHINRYYDNKKMVWVNPEDGTESETPSEFIIGLFDFCGCGNNMQFLKYLKCSLDVCKLLFTHFHTKLIDHDELNRRRKRLFKTDYNQMFMWYFLDKYGYTEHGGSVCAAWLTVEGEDMLADLTIICSKHYKDWLEQS